VAWSLTIFLTGFVADTQQLLVMRVLLGVAEAAYLPAALALIADYHDAKTRATAMGLMPAGSASGVVLGAVSLSYIGSHLGWRAGFYFLGALGFGLAVVAHVVLRDVGTHAGRPAPAIRAPFMANLLTIARVPSYLIIVFAGMSTAVGNWIFHNWLPLYFKENYGLSLVGAAFAGTFAFQSATVVAGLAGGIFSDWLAGDKPWRRMLIFACAALASAPCFLVFLSPHAPLVLVNAAIFTATLCLAFGACNLVPAMCELLPVRMRSTAVGVANAANCCAGGIGVVVAGYLKKIAGLNVAFSGISGIIVISASVMLTGYFVFVRRDLARRE
jgi:MFS family permease